MCECRERERAKMMMMKIEQISGSQGFTVWFSFTTFLVFQLFFYWCEKTWTEFVSMNENRVRFSFLFIFSLFLCIYIENESPYATHTHTHTYNQPIWWRQLMGGGRQRTTKKKIPKFKESTLKKQGEKNDMLLVIKFKGGESQYFIVGPNK